MRRKFAALLLLLCTVLPLCGCETLLTELSYDSSVTVTETTAIENVAEERTESPSMEAETAAPTNPPENDPLPASVEKDGSYTTPEDVAEYIHTFGTLPGNFITKKEAQNLGWDNKQGNLWDVAPDMSIGGDYFGNYEGILPEGNYHECDVNYDGGYRGAERLIYGDDGSIYYTADHYQTFTQLY